MSLVALDGTPLVPIGMANRNLIPSLPVVSSTLLDAANEAVHMIGQIFTADGASHTIDTTGSSAIEWLTAAVTFANAGSTLKVGLAAVNTSTGPPGRAANVADVVTYDVVKTHTGGGGTVTANAWQTNVPSSGTKTIANGDFVALVIQMTARAGADAVNVGLCSSIAGQLRPSVTSFLGGVYADASRIPNAVVTFSDGVLGFFYGSYVASVPSTSQTWNNGSATTEYGNFLQLPFPAKIYGIIAGPALGADADFILYSAPLGTPVAEKTVSVDANAIGNAAVGALLCALFPAPYQATASQPLAVIMKPTTSTNVSLQYKTFNAAAHQKSEGCGTNGYAVNRASGAFAAQNSNKDRFAIGLLVGAFDSGHNTLVNSGQLVA